MRSTKPASLAIAELQEFASFSAAEQRYIKRSLDVGLGRADAYKTWARDAAEHAAIRHQYDAYRALAGLRAMHSDERKLEGSGAMMGPLVQLAAFDLAQERIECFSAFRFLYERLLGPRFRPWLPAAFCGASALPQIRPERRKLLLQSISEAVATAPAWSESQPQFFPEFVGREAA